MRGFRKIYRDWGLEPPEIKLKAGSSTVPPLKVTRKCNQKKPELKPYVMAAHDFYKKEYESWKARQRKKAINSLKYYEKLIELYDGKTPKEIAADMGLAVNTIRCALSQTEARVEVYVGIIKENERENNRINSVSINNNSDNLLL